MIRYALRCEHAHRFEGWFASSAAFDSQQQRGDLACPACGSSAVEKTIMAPAVSGARTADASSEAEEPVPVAANLPETGEAIAILRKLRRHLTENADNVGPRFPEEARKIHYNEAEKRGIYGQATPDEARALKEEGIEFHPLPILPEDQN